MKKPIIAICYDFDGTLIKGNMQENSFIPEINMDKEDFWKEVGEKAREHDMDEVLAYMRLMLEKAEAEKQSFDKAAFKQHGKSVEFFNGVEQWFDIIKNNFEKKAKIEHYVISSGIDDMIKGSTIGCMFEHIYASGFFYDVHGVAKFPARSINYTNKVQYLFRINKGIKNSWDNSKINKLIPENERLIPFSRMIYIGDGYTDVPAMKMINYKGGYSIAVYPPKKGTRITKAEQEKKGAVAELKKDNRCQFTAPADYSEDGKLYKIVSALIRRIADEFEYDMNLNAR